MWLPTSKIFDVLKCGLNDNPLSVARERSLLCLVGIAVLYLGLAIGLSDVSVFADSADVRQAKRTAHSLQGEARADIYDRNDEVLAKNLPLVSLVADPSELLDADEAAQAIINIFPDLNESRVRKLLTRKSARYAMIKRGISPREQAVVNQAGIPGIYFEPSERRIYPHGHLFSHVVGFIGSENQGLMGLERGFDKYIRGQEQSFVRLSLDARAQFIVAQELHNQMGHFNAKGGSAIVMHVDTREVVAMVSLPDFDPHAPGKIPPESMFNHATQGLYEFGSVFKVFNSALSLKLGRSLTEDYYDVVKPLHVGGSFRVTDYRAKDKPLNIAEIFIYSSNIGSALMAWDSGAEAQKLFFKNLGLLKPLNTTYPETAKPNYPVRWGKTAVATLSYGHGIAVSGLHLTNAVTTIIGNGRHGSPRFTLGEEAAETGEPIITDKTIAQMRSLFRLNALRGSARGANVKGYRVGGKTGTAIKLKTDGSGYDDDKVLVDFIAAFPMDAPQYVVFLMLDEPSAPGIHITGGAVAAPVVGKIIKRLAPVLGVKPDVEKEKLLDEKLYLPLLQKEDKRHAANSLTGITNTAF